MIVRTVPVALALVLLLVAACSGPSAAVPAAVAGTCLRAGASPTGTLPAVVASPSAVRGADRELPDVSLACFDGSGAVRLDTLDRPAVVSLWASYCVPCHVELPHVEAFARAVGPAVAVMGVDTADTRSAADSVVTDLGLTYPMVFDPDQKIYAATAGRGLPATLFVAPGGKVLFVYEQGTPLDTATLSRLAATYLGVTVAG